MFIEILITVLFAILYLAMMFGLFLMIDFIFYFVFFLINVKCLSFKEILITSLEEVYKDMQIYLKR
jgi:hypothetical protein